MDWRTEHRRKTRTAAEAVACVKSGMNVYLQANGAFPFTLLEALVARADELRGVTMHHILGFGDPLYNRPELARSFRHNSLFTGANMRAAVAEGWADATPVHLSQIEALFASRRIPLDVALVQVAPPDEDGYCSLGVAVDITLRAALEARVVVAEVNDKMPRVCGERGLRVDQIDAFVPASHELAEVSVPAPDAAQRAIARRIADMIDDGDCLQTGIGGAPDAVLPLIADRKHLGVHTETFFSSMVPLIEGGAIDGERKQIDRGRIVAGFALGDKALYRLTDRNPAFRFAPCSYTNNPAVIAQNENVVAINSAVEVDVTGQVCSDSIGVRVISGFGGQVDFMRGAAMSKNGRPIIALPATTADGAISRIAPMLKPGAGVVTTRADVHWVVTEYGAVDLHGKNIRQRCEAMIPLAAPRFRAELWEHCLQSRHFQKPLSEEI